MLDLLTPVGEIYLFVCLFTYTYILFLISAARSVNKEKRIFNLFCFVLFYFLIYSEFCVLFLF